MTTLTESDFQPPTTNPPPVDARIISSIFPLVGPVAGGTQITIMGTQFTDDVLPIIYLGDKDHVLCDDFNR